MKKSIYLSIVLSLFIVNINAQIINIPEDYLTIQEGIDASVDGDTVLVQPGTYMENIVFNGKSIVLASTFIMTQDTNAIYQTIIDGQWWDRVVSIIDYEDETTLLTGFSIKNGAGGIQISFSNASVSFCRIYDNILPGDVGGAGIAIDGNGAVGIDYNIANVINCDIFNNNSRHGSGITLFNNRGVVMNCRIDNNTSWENGSQVMFVADARTIMKNCSINESNLKNYIIEFHGGCSPLLINNIITVSTPSLVFYSWESSSPILINNTIIGSSGQQGNLVSILPPSHFTIFNSIATGFYMADTMGYTSAYSRFDNLAAGQGNIVNDPLLNGDYSLSDCSPCIGAATDSFVFNDSTYYAPNSDYLGNIRPLPNGSSPDMGAIENSLGTPLTPPSITTQPIGTEICENGSYTLEIVAEGSPELTYQWQKDNVDLLDETNIYLILNNLTQGDEGSYRCLVANSCETIYSDNVDVSVLTAPLITTQPTGSEICENGSYTLEIVAEGSPELTYQWQKDNEDITDANSNTLILDNLIPSDEGSYQCLVTNICETISSDNVFIGILSPPSITTQPIGTEICEDDSYTLEIVAEGSPELTYQWQKDNVDLPDETNIFLILNNLLQSDEGIYSCLVTNSCETIYSDNVVINVLAPPSITMQPEDKYVYTGNGISFELEVSGDEPISYQWYSPNGILTGETLDFLLLTNLNHSDSGFYYCTITNFCSIVSTDSALLTIYDPLIADAGNDIDVLYGTATTLNGSYQGGSPSIGYIWSPDNLLVDPTVLNPQTLELFVSQEFTLTVVDTIVSYQDSDNVQVTVVFTDTLNYTDFGNDTVYEYNDSRSYCGYISGNNCDNDLIKAQYFYDDLMIFEINEILVHFGKAVKTSEEDILIQFGIWDNSGVNNSPGTLLSTEFLSLADIVENVNTEQYSLIELEEPVVVGNGFYVGVFLPQTEGDTIVLITNKENESEPNLSWTQKNNYEWSSYSQDPRWNLNISNAIFPIVSQINLGISNPKLTNNKYSVYPNPSSDRIMIKLQEQVSYDSELILIDLQGRLLEQRRFTNNINLDVQKLEPGIYLLSIQNNTDNETHKIVIQ